MHTDRRHRQEIKGSSFFQRVVGLHLAIDALAILKSTVESLTLGIAHSQPTTNVAIVVEAPIVALGWIFQYLLYVQRWATMAAAPLTTIFGRL